ncbi:MAG TPA: hypothetical protein VHI77_01145 [Solirubrobacterales bacterium]|jgi:hypothetical protein|nr:hypothetical protein [Solirubrobacterales bacterium]
MERSLRNAPVVLLGVALAAAAAMTLALTAEFTFLQDTWEFLMNRRDPSLDALLTPHNEHIVVFPVLIEELLVHIFGMTSARPEAVVLVIFLLATAALLFVYVRRRLGPWPALFAAVALLCLGPAWEALLWPFEITFIGPALFGLAMLLALERGDRTGDVAACAFLILALGFSGLGIPFLLAGAVAIAIGGRETWRRRAFVVAVPALLYAVWYLGWGHDAETHVTLHNVLASPRFVAEGLAAAVGALAGLGVNPDDGAVELFWGWAILAALVVALGYRQLRRPGFDRGLWPVAAAAAAYWFLMAFNQIPGREAAASRYQYGGAIFVLLILANLLHGARPRRNGLIALGAVTALTIGPNLVVLKNGRDTLEVQSVLTRSDTAALEIARRTVDPAFQLSPEVAGTGTLVDISAGPYFAAVDEYGSPAYSVAELAAAPEDGRRQSDVVLARALPLSTVTRLNSYRPGGVGGCTALPAGDEKPEVAVGSGLTRIEVAPGPQASFSLRRFAVGEYPVSTEGAAGGSVTLLRIPRDAAPRQPWYLRVEAPQPVKVCR